MTVPGSCSGPVSTRTFREVMVRSGAVKMTAYWVPSRPSSSRCLTLVGSSEVKPGKAAGSSNDSMYMPAASTRPVERSRITAVSAFSSSYAFSR